MKFAESVVLTEDDYLDFLVNVAQDEGLFPPVVQKACASTLILFIGFRLDDWNFRLIHKTLSVFMEKSVRRGHLAVMLPTSDEKPREEQLYLERYFQRSGFRIYWGTVQDFTSELRDRWESISNGK